MEVISFKTIIGALVGMYLLVLTIVFINERQNFAEIKRELNGAPDEESQELTYQFTRPGLAYQILSQLETVDELNPSLSFNNKSDIYINFRRDDEYCDKRRAYFVQFPESVFEEVNFVTDIPEKTLVRNKVLAQSGNDVQPFVGVYIPERSTAKFELKPSVNSFYTRKVLFYQNKIGQHYSCISQMSNHIPGRQALDSKAALTETVLSYAQRFENRPQCFNFNKFFPRTYVLYDKSSCQEFFKIFNSPEYQKMKEEKTIVYMRKIGRGVHNGRGVQPVNVQEEQSLRKMYDNGKKCGQVQESYLIQSYIHNPLLLNGHKFDFRMYMFIASTNPLIAYYHDGFLRVSIMEYDVESSDKKALLTNLGLNNEVYDEVKKGHLYQGMNEEELKQAQQWSFDRLLKYLLDKGIVTDSNWLDNYLRPEFKKAMIHLLRFGLITPLEDSTVYQLYGVDFMLDDNLQLWFIEANSAPGLDGYSEPMEKFIVNMLKQEIDISMRLLRSRMKRVINFVNGLISEGAYTKTEDGKVILADVVTNRVMFKKLTENKFEPEFEPTQDNRFAKIIDGNNKGADKYLGYVLPECV